MLLNVAGAVVHYDKFIKELPVIKLRNKGVDFTVYDGPNLCQWNGGRINSDITLTPEMVERYNKFGISVSLAFTNPVVNLDDEIGNHLLEMIDHYGKIYGITNKVVLLNDKLREYIRNRYNFQLIRSTTGHSPYVEITDELVDYYKDLESKFDYIVPKFELVFQPEFYNKIDTSKYELLINDTCVYGCPHMLEHFQTIALQNQLSKNPIKEFGEEYCKKIQDCWIDGFDPDITSEHECMDFSEETVEKAKSLGYNSFKFAGRENTAELCILQLKRFLR